MGLEHAKNKLIAVALSHSLSQCDGEKLPCTVDRELWLHKIWSSLILLHQLFTVEESIELASC